jgi:hypothetical protein
MEQLFLSSITIAEIKKGIYKIQNSQPERYQKLKIWLQKVEIEFYSRVLPIHDDILDNWAKFSANAELKGKKLAVMDSLIAATAHYHKLTLVTRNIDDFKMTQVKIINPYNLE